MLTSYACTDTLVSSAVNTSIYMYGDSPVNRCIPLTGVKR